MYKMSNGRVCLFNTHTHTHTHVYQKEQDQLKFKGRQIFFMAADLRENHQNILSGIDKQIDSKIDRYIMDIVYVDILTRENCHQFRLLIWNSLIDQFVHPVGMGLLKWMGGIVGLASCEYHFYKYIKIWCNIQVIIYLLL